MEIDKDCCFLKNLLSLIEKNLSIHLVNIDDGSSSDSKDHIAYIISIIETNGIFDNKNDDELRKIHLLLLINTDSPVFSDLEVDSNVGHAVGSIPRLSTYLYFTLTIKFKFINFLIEILENGPLKLVITLLDIIVDNIKSLPEVDLFDVLANILSVLYLKLTSSECNFTINKLYEYFEKLMLHYNTDCDDEGLKKKIQMKQTGYKFLSLLKLLKYILANKNGKNKSDCVNIIKINIPFDVTHWYRENQLKNKQDILIKCIEIVAFKCKLVMDNIEVNTFMLWHEININNKTLQTTIVEEVFRVCKVLKKNENSPNVPKDVLSLLPMLQMLAKEPNDSENEEEDKYMNASKQALEEIVSQTTNFDLSFLKAVESFLIIPENRFSYETTEKFIHKLYLDETKDKSIIRALILSLIKKLNFPEILKCLENFINIFGINNILYKPTVDVSCTFEKLFQFNDENETDSVKLEDYNIDENEVLREIALLSFQSADSIIKMVVKESTRQNKLIIIKLLETFKFICSYVPSANSTSNEYCLLISILKEFLQNSFQELSNIEKHSFTDLIIQLCKHNIINYDEVLLHCILPLLYIEENCDWETIIIFIKLANNCYVSCNKTLTVSSVIVVFQVAQLLEQCRWTLSTFSSQKLIVCEEIIVFIDTLRSSYSEPTNNELDWIKEKLSSFSPLTKSYFSNLFPIIESNCIETKLLSLIHGPIKEDNFLEIPEQQNTVILYLSKIVPILTSKELQNMVRNYSEDDRRKTSLIFNLMSDSITFISSAAEQYISSKNINEYSIFNCLGHTINNYLDLLQESNIFCSAADEDINFVKFINRISAILKTFPESMKLTYQFNVMKFISEMLPKLKETSNDFDGDTRQLLVGLFLQT